MALFCYLAVLLVFTMEQNEFYKRKNILDAQHQTYLNYFNIAAISSITIGFTTIFGYLTNQISWQTLITLLVVIFVISPTIMAILSKRMKGILDTIRTL